MKIFITATDTGVGKTYTLLKLLQLSKEFGFRAAAFKPIETGVTRSPEDGSKLLRKSQEINPNLKNLTIDDIVPYRFKLPAAPYVAKKGERIDLDLIEEKIEKIYAHCDILFIEGAGGLMVPIEKNFFMIDLIQKLHIPALLVTPSKLGCINQTLLSLEALRKRAIPHQWFINLFEDKESFYEVTYPFYKDYFDEVPLDLQSILHRYTHSYMV
ncbi:dethiobiotin synthetase [Nitratiruptor sp. YY08-26]|uniref:dethiobiotin synthase n=1 Tax=unclassified Nitratiruptor TaxID=2624044 RepID=UPI0019162298|nr:MULTISPECIES: dethiobiotin synthase [unclassified Nitratiruptor]BCD61562.1 dethiobiotin synthetase [Nitratiruptor sp. YY08-13]BCD65496.1 dethiobiotin synthetase [Nitratiruptor sp. YY08-26]